MNYINFVKVCLAVFIVVLLCPASISLVAIRGVKPNIVLVYHSAILQTKPSLLLLAVSSIVTLLCCGLLYYAIASKHAHHMLNHEIGYTT